MTNKNSGFTLIELLIAISILSALLFTGTYSYQLLADRWGKELGTFNNSSRDVKNIALLNKLLKGVQPFIIVEEHTNYKKPAFFFIGHENSLLTVSRSGFFSPYYPEIFRISAQQKESGLYDLIYQSASTRNILLLTAQQEINFEHKVTLFKDISAVNFNYLGWNGYMEYAESTNTLQPPTWRNKFSGIDNQLLPLKMEVQIKKDNKIIEFIVQFDRRTLRYLSPYIDTGS